MGNATGRTAVIVGGASGIGLGVAKRCYALNMNVVIADIDPANLAKLKKDFDQDSRVLFVPCDATKPEDMKRLADATYAKFGDVGLLMNNTGIMRDFSGYKTPLSDWKKMMAVTFEAVVIGCSEFVPRMLEQSRKDCLIVNTSSLAGLLNSHYEAGTPYTVAKHATRIYTEALASELKKTSIKLHVLCPGPVDTPLLLNSRKNKTEKFDFEKTSVGMSEKALAEGLSVDQVVNVLETAIRDKSFYAVALKPPTTLASMTEIMRLVVDDVERGASMPLSYRNSRDPKRREEVQRRVMEAVQRRPQEPGPKL